MTDYLALALEQDEERDEEETPELELTGEGFPIPLRPRETPEPSSGEKAPAEEGEEAPEQGVSRALLLPETDASAPVVPDRDSPLEAALPEGLTLEWEGTSPSLPGGLSLFPVRGERERSREDGTAALLEQVRRAERGADFVRQERRAFSVTLPRETGEGPGWSAEELDRAVERDARRYGGSFALY